MYEAVETVAREAGAIALEHFGHLSSLAVKSKGPLDLVTAADHAVEQFLSRELRRLFPEDGVFGEEGAAFEGTSGRTWVIDPIDGTLNFVRGSDCWAISIGLYEKNVPIFGIVHAAARGQFFSGGVSSPPTRNGVPLRRLAPFDPSCGVVSFGFLTDIPIETRLSFFKFAMRDAAMTIRHNGSAAISLMEVACGEVDGHVGIGVASWDVMGSLPILASLGGVCNIDWSRTPLSSRLHFICGRPEVLTILAPMMQLATTPKP